MKKSYRQLLYLHLKRAKGLIIIGANLLLISIACIALYPIIALYMIKSLHEANLSFVLLSLILLFLLIIKETFEYIAYYLFEKTNRIFRKSLSTELASRIQNHKENFQKFNQGDLLVRIDKDSENLATFLFPLTINACKETFTLLIAFVIGVYINWQLSIVIIIPLLCFISIRN